jgi:hypothetical protein
LVEKNNSSTHQESGEKLIPFSSPHHASAAVLEEAAMLGSDHAEP